ncbi:MAG: hypothetical protein HY666_05105 [Chloroflexi bacterium]|nr:hypothetical protein [Chloroflexota bacterium]
MLCLGGRGNPDSIPQRHGWRGILPYGHRAKYRSPPTWTPASTVRGNGLVGDLRGLEAPTVAWGGVGSWPVASVGLRDGVRRGIIGGAKFGAS